MEGNAAPVMADVTVVMACYNRSDLILRALESIRIQRIWPHQVIVVDDASADDSVVKVRAWGNRTGFPVIVEALERNGGAALARNRGIELAKTTYVAFVDSDDEQMGDALGKLVGAIDSNPGAVLSFGEGTKITPTETIPDAMFRSKVDMANECQLLSQETPFYKLRDAKSTMLRASLVPTSASCFKRVDALAVGGMPAQFRTGEDWLFWLKLSERGDFIYVPENLACVHRHADNLTHPGSAAQTSQHKLAGFLALLDGSAGIQINAQQRARIRDFADARAKLLRYQASRLGLGPYLHSLRNLPPSRRKSLLSHLIEDPKSMLRAVSCLVRPAPPPQTR
jgi:hypothetical protein